MPGQGGGAARPGDGALPVPEAVCANFAFRVGVKGLVMIMILERLTVPARRFWTLGAWFLLVASLAINVFFVAGVIYPRLMGHHHPPRDYDPVARAAEEFSLDAGQTEALTALRGGRPPALIICCHRLRDGFTGV